MESRPFQLTVKQFPNVLTVTLGKAFLSDLQNNMGNDRPSVVLDLSNIGPLDKAAVTLLLDCLEEALKRNGDVKLVGIPEDARAILMLTGVDRLFGIFNTEAEAISSFRRPHQYAQSNMSNAARGLSASGATA